jgi:hypothetical protein
MLIVNAILVKVLGTTLHVAIVSQSVCAQNTAALTYYNIASARCFQTVYKLSAKLHSWAYFLHVLQLQLPLHL